MARGIDRFVTFPSHSPASTTDNATLSSTVLFGCEPIELPPPPVTPAGFVASLATPPEPVPALHTLYRFPPSSTAPTDPPVSVQHD